MSLDPLSPAAPARIRTLLVPIGQLRQSRFGSFVKRLKKDHIVRLGDVSPDSRPHRTLFSPLAFSEGLIVYDLSSATPPASQLSLIPFELYRQPLLVVGILDGHEEYGDTGSHSASGDNSVSIEDPESLRRSLDDLRADFPSALLHQLLIFDIEKDQRTLPEDVMTVSSPEKSRTTTVKTVMCDMTSRLLGEMNVFAKTIQSMSNLETPKVSNTPTINDRMLSALPSYLNGSSRPGSATERSRSYSPAGDDSKLGHRMSLPAHMPSNRNSRSSTPDSRAASPHSGSRTPPIAVDEISGAPDVPLPPSPQRPSHDRIRNGSQDRGSRPNRSDSLGDREKIKGKGRIGVVIGSMYLLAGRWPDAVKELVQSANITRANSDYVWQAKALDHLLVCLLMYAWAGMDFRIPDAIRPGAQRPGSNASKSSNHKNSNNPSESSAPQNGDPAARLVTLASLTDLLPDLVNNILNLYARAWTFTDDKIPPLSYSYSTIRLTKLLTAIRLGGGQLNDIVLRNVILNKPLPSRISTTTNIRPFMSASELSSLLLRAYPTPSPESPIPISDRTNILAAIAAVLSQLGYIRKKAVVLKELLSVLLPALVQARKDGAAEMGVHPAASLASLDAATGNGFAEQSGSKSDDPEQAMRHFLSLVCQSFGIIPRDRIENANQTDGAQATDISASRTAKSIAFAIRQASLNQTGSQDLKVDILRSCINICEALPNLAGALEYSAELLRTAGSGIAPGPESRNGTPALPMEEQMRLSNNISRTLNAAQHLGLQHPEADYWDEFLVRGIEIVDGNPSKSLVPHAKSELEIVETIETKKEKNPFIYNPFLKTNASAVAEPLLVATDEAIFRVELQNLYDFDLYIERIQLEADDVDFKSHPQSIMVGPYRTQKILLSGTPQQPGNLKVTGCLVKIRGCRERSFSIYKEPWELKVDIKGRNIQPNFAVEEKKGRDSTDLKISKPVEGPKASCLCLSIMAAQPTLQLSKISVPQSAIMLLEGETRTFTITLRNSSHTTPADLVLLSFNDSTAAQVQTALASKELSEIELYELELSISRKQSFRWLRKTGDHESIKIEPQGELTLEIEVLGKPGLSSGTIQVDYGYLDVLKSDVKDRFYTRQLKIPLAVSVNAAVHLSRTDVTPLPADFGYLDQPGRPIRQNEEPHTRPSLIKQSITSHLVTLSKSINLSAPQALLLLEFHNSWPSILTLNLNFDSILTYHSILPGSSLRIPLPHPKIHLPPSAAYASIPSHNPATARQFVVPTSSKYSPEAELALREAFWYREELLKRLNASWIEEGTGRSGEVDVRALKLTGRMVSLIRLGDVDISMSISTAEPDHRDNGAQLVKQIGERTFHITIGSFNKLKTTLRNRSEVPIRPLLRLQPTLAGQPHNIALDLGKKLLVNGILQRALPLLKPGEERCLETGFCALSAGVYEWNACVEEVKGAGKVEGGRQRARAKTGELDFKGAVGRRVWYGEGPCIVVARDKETAFES